MAYNLDLRLEVLGVVGSTRFWAFIDFKTMGMRTWSV